MSRRVPSAGEFKNFGGINQSSTKLNLKSPYAEDIDNLNITGRGAIETRLEPGVLSTFEGTVHYATAWLETDNTQYYCVIAGSKLYVATDPAGPWTDRTGSVTITDGTAVWSSVSWRGALYLTNGVDQPIMVEPGEDAVTMKDASLLTPPQNLEVTKVGTIAAGSKPYWLVVEAVTGRGSTGTSVAPTRLNYNMTLVDGSNYLQLNWDEVESASVIRIWLSSAATATAGLSQSYYNLLAELPGSATEYIIQSILEIPNSYTFDQTNTAYNTPEDWDDTGQPTLFSIISRGRDERMVAARRNLVFFSGLGDPLDWYTPGNAFGLTINGGSSDNVTAVTNLYDFYTFFSTTDGFLYRNASPESIDQDKIVPVGCSSPMSIVYADGDVWLWSTESGPTAMRRVVSGADVEVIQQFTAPVREYLEDVNRNALDRITGVYDADNRRLVWFYPTVGSSDNNAALVYQLDCKGWTHYSGDDVRVAFINQSYTPFLLKDDGTLCSLDGGTGTPTGYYKTPWFETGGWDNKKRLQYIDVAVSSEADYNIDVTYAWDYGSGPTETVAIVKSGTTVTTNGMNVDASRKGPMVNIHRIFTKGNGVAWQLTLEPTTTAVIYGWKPEYLVLGGRN